MASSKVVSEDVLVPKAVIDLSLSFPGVVICNLRPSQRKNLKPRSDRKHYASKYGDGCMISDDFERFLDCLEHPIMAVMLYQLYGPEICTVVVQLEPVIYWTGDGLPRLEFDQPENWNHCPNMWGGFVLSVAQVEDIGITPVISDQNAEHFIEIAKSRGIQTTWMK